MEKARAAGKGPAVQEVGFLKGDEMVALAAKQINFHLMGYFPITPSTEIAEELDEMFARGEHQIRLLPADGEHGAAGICYGAATGGGRVLNATSANGLLYSMEQLPVQSGTRFPMVLNVVTRSVSGPLDIRGDHSDLMMALNTGWIILLARDPQAAYDMNIIAVQVSEHPEIRLPVIVAMDGFFTSHQKRKVRFFQDSRVVQEFIGPTAAPITTVDPSRPVTIGPYMNDPDLISNKYQLNLAMNAAERLIPQIFDEYGALSGRYYPMVDSYLHQLRPRRAREAHPGRPVVGDDGKIPAPPSTRACRKPPVFREGNRAKMATAEGDARAPAAVGPFRPAGGRISRRRNNSWQEH